MLQPLKQGLLPVLASLPERCALLLLLPLALPAGQFFSPPPCYALIVQLAIVFILLPLVLFKKAGVLI